jgi:hypothetical protein
MLVRIYCHNFFLTKVYRERPIEDECANVTLVALVSGFEVLEGDLARLKTAHIFSRTYGEKVCLIEPLLF